MLFYAVLLTMYSSEPNITNMIGNIVYG